MACVARWDKASQIGEVEQGGVQEEGENIDFVIAAYIRLRCKVLQRLNDSKGTHTLLTS